MSSSSQAAAGEHGKGMVALAYSGGLDTTVVVHRLTHEHGRPVAAILVDVGQNEDLETAAKRAMAAGAVKAIVVDARQRFADHYLTPAIAANALYEGKYPLVSALSRPLISQVVVEHARALGATAVAHGCTGKGNDQVRLEVAFGALAPDLEVLAPVRDWAMSRPEALAYADAKGLDLGGITAAKPYSIDANLWGRAIECGVLEDPWNGAPEEPYTMTRAPQRLDQVTEVVVGFDGGVPVSIDGDSIGLLGVVERLNELGGAVGFGRLDMVENRRVGIKSREIYEVPGALAALIAHQDLEALTLERDLLREKQALEARYAELVYDGLWFSPLKRALDAFMSEAQEAVTGEVRLRFAPWSCQPVGRRSPRSLYQADLATYEESGDGFDHSAAAGFVALWGLSTRTWSAVSRRQHG
jgi:argininosuccinate synthase